MVGPAPMAPMALPQPQPLSAFGLRPPEGACSLLLEKS